MRNRSYSLIIALFILVTFHSTLLAQVLTTQTKDKITAEVAAVFDKSIAAGEKLDTKAIAENVNDSLKTGFIDNGHYINTFDEMMVGVAKGMSGLEYQKMNVTTKKITVLSEKHVLLTACGDFTAKITDGKVISGKFAWTFVYSKIKGNWKIIHSHMSNPR